MKKKFLFFAAFIFAAHCILYIESCYGQWLFGEGLVSDSTKAFKHEGFYSRATLGFGSTNISESYQGTKMEISGLSGDFNAQIGYSVVENLQLYFVLGVNAMSDPKYKFNGTEATATKSSDVTLYRYGAGATYYFMPHNIFVSFDITSGQNEIKIDNESVKSKYGAVFNFGAGKEWWVSKEIGLGGMVYFYYGSISDETINGVTPKLNNTGFGLSFSATFN